MSKKYISVSYPKTNMRDLEKGSVALVDLLNEMDEKGYEYIETFTPMAARPAMTRCLFVLVDPEALAKAEEPLEIVEPDGPKIPQTNKPEEGETDGEDKEAEEAPEAVPEKVAEEAKKPEKTGMFGRRNRKTKK